MFPIIALVGPSGSGKSTIASETIKRLPDLAAPLISTTTRPRRGPDDDLFYEFVTSDEINARIQAGRAVNRSDYTGNIYIYDRAILNNTLSTKFGLNAIVEGSIETIRQAGYKVLVVKIIPVGTIDPRSPERIKADEERAKLTIKPDLVIENDFTYPNGLEQAVDKLIAFIQNHAVNPNTAQQ